MDSGIFTASPCGRIVHTQRGYDAFVPAPLPVAVDLSPGVVATLERSAFHLGELAGNLFCPGLEYTTLLQARDAVRAVRTEHRRLTLEAFFTSFFHLGTSPDCAVQLARNYISTLQRLSRRMEELPLSLRLLREIHRTLLEEAADPRVTPGQFRRSQNWIGPDGCVLSTATFVPPPAKEMHEVLDNWEKYLHSTEPTPRLVALALAYHQYLVIHPFLSMNELAGALLAAAMAAHFGLGGTSVPVFGCLLQRQSATLQQRMLDVCARGAREEWLCWYLQSLADVARETLECLRGLRYAHQDYRNRLLAAATGAAAHSVLDLLFIAPVVTTQSAARDASLSENETAAALTLLQSLHIVSHRGAAPDGPYAAEDIIRMLERPALPFDYAIF